MSKLGYDAFLLVSFGGPEGTDDVIPFLENVTRGRGIPAERLAEVGEHYHRFGGVSPINQQCRELAAAIEARFAASGLDLPVYWGNRNWKPYLTDTVRQMAHDGVRRAVAFVTSAYSLYSSCRQYLEDIERARAQAGPRAPKIDKVRPYFNHPGFIEPLAENTHAALATLSAAVRDHAHLIFTAHSAPTAMAAASGPDGGAYVAQLTEVARLVSERVDGGTHPWRLVFQSRSGPPSQPWLEPDVGDYLAELAGAGAQGAGAQDAGAQDAGAQDAGAQAAKAAVLVPSGFVSDHMEVRYDLDVVAAQLADRLGITVARAATPGVHPRFVAMVSELVAERLTNQPNQPERLALGSLGACPDQCPAGCCVYSRFGNSGSASSGAAGAAGANSGRSGLAR